MSDTAIDHVLASLFRVNTTATLAAGDKAIYPCVGPCRIAGVEKRIVDTKVVMFYHLIVLDGGRGELFIPVEKAAQIGLRLMIDKSEIPKLLAHLRERGDLVGDWRQRATDNSKLFTSGSPFDLAEIVASLTELSGTKALTFGQTRTLGKAKRLLVCEISEVMGETETAAEEQIDRALKERSAERGPVNILGAATASLPNGM